MQASLSNSLKTIEFFVESKNAELSIQNINAVIKTIKGVECTEVNPTSGKTRIALENNSLFDKNFMEIQKVLFKAGYVVKMKDTDGEQVAFYLSLMGLGFLIVIVVMVIYHWSGLFS